MSISLEGSRDQDEKEKRKGKGGREGGERREKKTPHVLQVHTEVELLPRFDRYRPFDHPPDMSAEVTIHVRRKRSSRRSRRKRRRKREEERGNALRRP